MNNTKEEIKNRMLKNAASQWGIPANEIEKSFDPVIALLLGACASELEKISEKIGESQNRVTEKIIQLMTPETIFGPRPAHAILYTNPLEEDITITPEYLFSFKKKDIQKATSRFKEIFYSPAENFSLVNARATYLVHGNEIASINESKEKETLFSSNKDIVDSGTLFIGLQTETDSLSLEGGSLYFENQDLGVSKFFFHQLKNAKWFYNDKELNVVQGFGDSDVAGDAAVASFLNEDSIKIANIIDEVKNHYTKNFVTFHDTTKLKKKLPSEFKDVISANRVAIEEDVIWLKVVFPKIVTKSAIKSVYCSLNCFPALNRKLETFSYKLKDYIDVIPITTNNLFLDVKTIENTDGDQYAVLNRSIKSDTKGVYALKTDSIKKIDNRKAKEYIAHLIELLKDESASFSYLNNDFLQNNLTQLNQIIALLENKVSHATNETLETNYISVKPLKTKDNLIIEYWTTDGELGNNISYGNLLKNYKTVGLKQKETRFMTSTLGGKNSLNMQERLHAYRRTLLSRDKIVTKEDVKLACFEFFGDKLKAVEIKNGYTVNPATKKGMVNCIQILLKPNTSFDVDRAEWEFIENNLLLFLQKKSTAIFPYVIINN